MDAFLVKVECLSPVHVGSGQELIREIDFHPAGGVTEVLNSEDLLPVLPPLGASSPQRLREELGRRVGELLRQPGFDVSPYRLHRVAGTITAQRLRLAVRNADGRAIIPGSSLKGAVRTLLLAGLVSDGVPHTRRLSSLNTVFQAAARDRRGRSLEDAVFRSDARGIKPEPRSDLLRMVAIADAPFAREALGVVSTVAVNTGRTTLTAVETLKPGALSVTRVTLGDEFLAARLFSRSLPGWTELCAWSRAHSLYLLEADLRYFRDLRLEAVTSRLEHLIELVRNEPEDSTVLRLGWGSGWRTMTGDLLTEAERTMAVNRVGKTRKVIIEGHAASSTPCDVLGWIRLRPVGTEEAAAIIRAAPPPPRRATTFPPQAPAVQAGLPESFRADPFEQRMTALRATDYGQVGGLYQQIASAAHSPERERRLRLLAARLKELFGKDKKKLERLRKYEGLAQFLE